LSSLRELGLFGEEAWLGLMDFDDLAGECSEPAGRVSIFFCTLEFGSKRVLFRGAGLLTGPVDRFVEREFLTMPSNCGWLSGPDIVADVFPSRDPLPTRERGFGGRDDFCWSNLVKTSLSVGASSIGTPGVEDAASSTGARRGSSVELVGVIIAAGEGSCLKRPRRLALCPIGPIFESVPA